MTTTRRFTADIGTTGLTGTLAYTVTLPGGTVVVPRATAGVVEKAGGRGIYYVDIPNFDVAWAGDIDWDVAGVVLATLTFGAVVAGGSSSTGPGADQVTLTWTNSTTGLPVADGDAWVTTDAVGAAVVAGTLQTDSEGKVTFLLDAGNTYYAWFQKNGVNPVRGTQFVAEAD